MPTGPTRYSDAFRQSIDLLLRLHHEMTKGDPNGEVADSLRSRSEGPWYAMSVEEQEVVRGLSADLYSIGQPSETPLNEADADFSELLRNAETHRHWTNLLERVREYDGRLSQHLAAFLRWHAWLKLGERNVAVEFLKEAIARCPADAPEKSDLIALLFRLAIEDDRIDLAMEYFPEFEARGDDPSLLLLAAEILFRRSIEVVPTTADEMLKRASAFVTRAIAISGPKCSNSTTDALRAHAHLWMALYLERCGEATAADHEIDEARRFGANAEAVSFVQTLLTNQRRATAWSTLAQPFTQAAPLPSLQGISQLTTS